MNAGTLKRSIRAVAANARHPLRLVNVARNRLNRGSPEVPTFLPYSLDVEPTTHCNLRCPMCLHTYWDREPGDMSPETFRRLLDGAPQLVKLKLQGMGEPLLSPHFFDLIAEAGRRDIMTHTVSNGTTLTPGVIARLADSPLAEIQVSFDTPRKESYERIRCGADFDDTLKKLEALCAARRRLLVSIWAVAWDFSAPEMPELVRLAARLGVDSLFISFGLGNWGDRRVADAVGGHRPSREQIEDAAARCREADTGRTTVVVLTGSQAGGGGMCRWPWRSAFVTWDGHVTPCCGMMDPRQFNLGNINEQTFGDIWRGPAYRKLRRRILANDLPPACCAICGAPPKRDTDGRSK